MKQLKDKPKDTFPSTLETKGGKDERNRAESLVSTNASSQCVEVRSKNFMAPNSEYFEN